MIRPALVLVALLAVVTAGLVLGAAPAPAVAVVGEVGVTQPPAPPASSSERRAKRPPPITRTVDGAGCCELDPDMRCGPYAPAASADRETPRSGSTGASSTQRTR